MVSVMVFVKRPGGESWEGLGRREFEALPRLGEHVGDDTFLYRVVSLQHPFNPTMAAGDLYAVQVERIANFTKKLFEESR